MCDRAHGKHDFMDIAKILLMDYAKSNGFELFITGHWNRHLATQTRKIRENMEIGHQFDTGKKTRWEVR